MNISKKDTVEQFIINSAGARGLVRSEQIQELWSGYGSICRCYLDGSSVNSVIVKKIQVPKAVNHPRGWSGKLAHLRKLKSYQVELEWYKNWCSNNHPGSYIPRCYGFKTDDLGENVIIILEDLKESGFPELKTSLSIDETKVCLTWLASFHAHFMGFEPKGLWEVGTYWHLGTRPEELEALEDERLKKGASKIDERLNNCQFKTIVHGDSKLANFCFSNDGKKAAAVDFQYVGGGCGIKDVAYFIGSSLTELECEKSAEELLDFYFTILGDKIDSDEFDFNLLLKEWRELYPFAWADFHRFLKGWSPGHWKLNGYSEKLTKSVLESL